MDSFNVVPPFLGQRQPDYPPLLQLLRVTSTTTSGPAGILYEAWTQQLRTDTLAPRDREACLVVDVNGLGLVPAGYLSAYHLGRLAGAYNSLPVYEVTVLSALPSPTGSGSGLSNLFWSFRHYRDDCVSGCLYRMRQDVSLVFDIHGYRTMLGSWQVDAILGPMDCGNCGSGSDSGSGSFFLHVSACCSLLVPSILCLNIGGSDATVCHCPPVHNLAPIVDGTLKATFQTGGIGPDDNLDGWQWLPPPFSPAPPPPAPDLGRWRCSGLMFELYCDPADLDWHFAVYNSPLDGSKGPLVLNVNLGGCPHPFEFEFTTPESVLGICGVTITDGADGHCDSGGGGGGGYTPSCCGAGDSMPTDSVRFTFHAPDCDFDGLFCFAAFSGFDYAGSVSFGGKTLSGILLCDPETMVWKLTLLCSAGGAAVTTSDALFQCGGPHDDPAVSGTFGFDLEACCGGGITVTVTS